MKLLIGFVMKPSAAQEIRMPTRTAMQRARKDARLGKAPSTQAGEFVREVMHRIRAGKHGARSAKQAIAIGLSIARRAGIALPPKPGTPDASHHGRKRLGGGETSAKRSRAALSALKKEPTSSASHAALARHARRSAIERGRSSLHAAAMKAVATKAAIGRRLAAKKAAATRKRAG